MVVLITLGMLAGGLYNTMAQLDTVEEEGNEYALFAFPYEMPDMVIHPAPSYGLF